MTEKKSTFMSFIRKKSRGPDAVVIVGLQNSYSQGNRKDTERNICKDNVIDMLPLTEEIVTTKLAN